MLASVVKARAGYRANVKEQGRGKPILEEQGGDDIYRRTGRWSKFVRLIDRRSNRYLEEFKDEETGEVVHRTDEPLTHHTGHGSDRGR